MFRTYVIVRSKMFIFEVRRMRVNPLELIMQDTLSIVVATFLALGYIEITIKDMIFQVFC